MSPLRVLVIVDDLRVAGAQRGLTEELRALPRERVVARVVALAAPAGPSVAPELATAGVPVSYLPGRGLRDLGRLLRLARLIRAAQPDLVHTYLDYASLLGPLAARLAGRPAVVSLRNLGLEQERWNGPKQRLAGLVIRFGAARAIVGAEQARATVCRNFGLPAGQVVVLPNAIGLERLRLPADYDRAAQRRALGLPVDEPLICTVGRLETVKGSDLFVEAAEQLIAAGWRGRFLLLGDGSLRTELTQRLARTGLIERIKLLGQRSDVAEIVAACDLFVQPSRREALSRALLEAMALGVPVVATAVGGTADAVRAGQTGWLVSRADADELARAIKGALGNPVEAGRLAVAGRRLVQEQFSIEGYVQRLEGVYREAAGRSSRS
jgi:glycosyltransferase involved in cell wall biosynthesis